ncbi:hypothetical protein ACGFZQ_01010 [Streptomyces sp. NPDC048254]|uniref:hypothetical protein n=1 Tax=Streptomyces sp. NPDC048254 TaxID=3365525 RepID=UPI003714232C
MRLSTSLSLCVAAAAVLAPVPSATVAPLSSSETTAPADASCAGADEQGFPLATRIHDGPSSYEAGGGYGTWYLDLTNTTDRTCTDVHPVVVLVDDKRALKPSQAELEFYDGPRTRPVQLTETDESELVGVFDGDGFPGLTVAPGATVSVKVRLAVASDAVPNAVTANAAVVQRRGSDGDWVGESDDYRFGIGGEPPPASAAPAVPSIGAEVGPGTSPGISPGTSAGTGPHASPGTSSGTGSGVSPKATPEVTPEGTPTASPGIALPFAEAAEEAGERARELAGTGLGLAHGLLAAAVALLAVGGSVFLLARRRR